MQQLNMNEIEAVSGGVNVTGVSYTVGLATSVGIGLSLGPVGAIAAAAGYSIGFAVSRALM